MGFSAIGQNLVPNGSFEINTSCPSTYSEIYKAPPWSSSGTSDLFNPCNNSLNGIVGVPGNFAGFQNPLEGSSYAGIVSLWLTGFGWEFLQVKLTQPLDSGKTYCISFYVNLSDSSSYAVDSLGAYVSDTTFNLSSVVFLPTPQALSLNHVTDKVNWTKIQSSFVASGGEKLITVGHFSYMIGQSSSHLFVGGGCGPTVNPSCASSYYYIDSVSVMLCPEPGPPSSPTESNIIIPNVFTPNGDGINDVFYIESTGIESMSCEIFNRWGIKVATLSRLNEGWDGRTTSGQEATEGVYYYVVTAKGTDSKEYRETGFIQLLR